MSTRPRAAWLRYMYYTRASSANEVGVSQHVCFDSVSVCSICDVAPPAYGPGATNGLLLAHFCLCDQVAAGVVAASAGCERPAEVWHGAVRVFPDHRHRGTRERERVTAFASDVPLCTHDPSPGCAHVRCSPSWVTHCTLLACANIHMQSPQCP